MKKFALAFTTAATMTLTACATTGTGTSGIDAASAAGTATEIGMNVFKYAVDAQCRTQLRNNNTFRTVALAMTPQQQTQVENNICGCVTEYAPQSVTVVDLTQAAIDPNARAQIVSTAVQKTLTACYGKFVR
ncbi:MULTISPECIES: hypothetical protein [unclassified Acinetobacter]|uniref:hypothetical protein n=1 Tax=unclassified Acinetobacter TaxID=196816 RepID=UPI0035B95144